MFIESLESRRMLAAATSVTFAAGVVTITVGTKPDFINVVENNGVVHVELNNGQTQNDYGPATAVKIIGSSKPDTLYYTGNTIGANIQGNGGNDNISVDDEGTGSSIVDGGNGADNITVIHGNHTVVTGGTGNDLIYVNTDGSSSSSVVVDGGAGNDTVTDYGGSATLQGGSGSDTQIDASGGTALISSSGFETFYAY
jgi:Ca2+-binding RTX toxin-like protein